MDEVGEEWLVQVAGGGVLVMVCVGLSRATREGIPWSRGVGGGEQWSPLERCCKWVRVGVPGTVRVISSE